jgi:serine phosphatase RsbU (regulator of sigma subunit)
VWLNWSKSWLNKDFLEPVNWIKDSGVGLKVNGNSVPSILIVDDEELVLSSLRWMLTLQTDYEVIEANDPQRALEQIKGTSVDVVISDFLMPAMNGIEFLKGVRRLQPEAVRILLTGYGDKENAIRAINEVGLYHYLEKPWDNEALLMVIRNALEEKSLRRQLREKMADLDRLSLEHTTLARRHRSIQQELEMAAEVQRRLLPPSLPEMEGFRFAALYRPCQTLGGDYYDFSSRGKFLTFLISDVIGHGVQAALVTMLLKGVYQETATRTRDPVQLLTEMNSKLQGVLPEQMYVAASVLNIDPTSREIHFANAGLPYPFVLRASERRVEEVSLAGFPLGLFKKGALASYEARQIALASGDVLLLATDGLGSVAGRGEDFFEDRQLGQVLAELPGRDGQEVIRTVLERAIRFSEEQPIPDDVSLLAITRT